MQRSSAADHGHLVAGPRRERTWAWP